MEVLDPYDKYLGIVWAVNYGVLINSKCIFMINKKNNRSYKWYQYYVPGSTPGEQFRGLTVLECMKAMSPFFLGDGKFFKLNLVLTLIFLLLTAQIIL